MIDSLIDEIRRQERALSDIATEQSKASKAASDAAKAVEEQTSNIERLRLTERSLTEASGKLQAQATRAIRRGLLPSELNEALLPFASKAAITKATKATLEAIDQESKVMLELQRISSEANAALKQVEVEFSEAEDQLETLRDQLRILQQSQPA